MPLPVFKTALDFARGLVGSIPIFSRHDDVAMGERCSPYYKAVAMGEQCSADYMTVALCEEQ